MQHQKGEMRELKKTVQEGNLKNYGSAHPLSC